MLMVAVLLPGRVWADELSTGDTAWMLTSTALVLFMTTQGWPCFTADWFVQRTYCLF